MAKFLASIRSAVRRIRKHPDEGHVHAFRIAVKRLKAIWDFREVITGERVASAGRQPWLKAFRAAGDYRDLGHVLSNTPGTPEGRHPDQWIRKRQKARKALIRHLAHPRLQRRWMKTQIREWSAFLREMNDTQAAIAGERYYLRTMDRLLSRLAVDPTDADLHRIRKDLKHLLYIGQWISERLPEAGPWNLRLAGLKRVTTLLGDWHDQAWVSAALPVPDLSVNRQTRHLRQAALQAVRDFAGLGLLET